jgi:O-antigen/teichoic acid export membrane protein
MIIVLINEKNKKITIRVLFLSIIYLIACCIIFFFISNAVIDLIFDGKVNLTREIIINIIVVSIISGTVGGLGSWIFAKLDERKSRKTKPSDPQ